MELKPNSLSMKNLLNRYDVLQVPNFQRDYSWDKPYYSAFLEDIIKTLVSTTDSDQVTPKDYFIGTMVLAGKENENVMDVVDGQQRLTVVTILLSVLTRKFFSLEEDDLGEGTFRYFDLSN